MELITKLPEFKLLQYRHERGVDRMDGTEPDRPLEHESIGQRQS